jgi:hypothetical protein
MLSFSILFYSPTSDGFDAFLHGGLVESLHVGMHLLEVFAQGRVNVALGRGAKPEAWLVTVRLPDL